MHRRGAAYLAHGAFFSADGIFLCKLLPEAPRLVCEHKALQKAFGFLCKEEGYDGADQARHHHPGDAGDGDRIFHDDAGECGGAQRHPCHRLGLSYHLFCFRGQDHTKRTIRRKGLRRRKIYKYIRKTGQQHMQASEGKGEVVRNNFPFSLWIIEQHINNRFNNLAIPFAALLKQSQQLFFFRLGFLFRIKDAVGR